MHSLACSARLLTKDVHPSYINKNRSVGTGNIKNILLSSQYRICDSLVYPWMMILSFSRILPRRKSEKHKVLDEDTKMASGNQIPRPTLGFRVVNKEVDNPVAECVAPLALDHE